MGYMMLTAPCFACDRLFASNPDKVPSYDNQPVCRSCIERVNAWRKTKGLPLWPIPDDAYEPQEVQ